MNFLTRRFSKAPEGTVALFFIQIFSTLGFAVLYSTLVLYATKHLQLGVKKAITLMGVFGAFNYGLHLFGGYLGGRFLSNRKLFVGGMALQVFGCACIATGTLALFYVGLAFFLTGSGLNVTCINMMLSRSSPPYPRRAWGICASIKRTGFMSPHLNRTKFTRLCLMAQPGASSAMASAGSWMERIKRRDFLFSTGSLGIRGRNGFTSTSLSTRRPLHCRVVQSCAK